MGMKIGELAELTGTTAPTIRYYEDIGLLPAPARVGHQRRYGQDDARRLTLIRRCRKFGFSLDQIRMLTCLIQDDERPCSDARDLAQAHLEELRDKLRELHALERDVAMFIEAADDVCPGGSGPDCVVLEQLAESSASL
ncbi:MerR family transcriptional regulator [Bradyrhizobium oligotrophicum S58] [Mycobacterium shimoidei]|uniref:MerR family transcriptional regulator [Bradyrhizobium oligotrophicum S58] n=2 Tax=Mycobacterium shimoidei TaxID=29313 RepID=A0A375YXF0_MYCSH|nr:MerR family transcriptional regulator [Bradyrhizobium oligotrophicum S58] [Mycobacterium shimoidei]